MYNGYPIELYPLLKANAPQVIRPYDTYQKFGNYFCWDGVEGSFKGASNQEEFRERLTPFMLRREKDVLGLPPILNEDVYMDIGSMERDLSNTRMGTVRRLVGEQKLSFALEYTKDKLLDDDDDRYLIFVYHRMVAATFANELNCGLIYGGTSNPQKVLDRFLGGQDQALVLQINAAGDAIDRLQYACHKVIFPETDWPPGAKDQAISRVRRWGQIHPVEVTHLIAVDTIDEPMKYVQHKKQRNINVLLNKQKGRVEVMAMTEEEFRTRIVAALESIAGGMVEGVGDDPKPDAAKNGRKNAKGADTAGAKNAATGTKVELQTVRDKATELVNKYGKSEKDKELGFNAVGNILAGFKMKNAAGEDVAVTKCTELGEGDYTAALAAFETACANFKAPSTADMI